MFFEGSRYEDVPEAEIETEDGRTVRYKRIRRIPDVEGSRKHVVREGERLDLVAADRLGDPERFWRICDANRELWPPALTEEPERRLRLPPEAE